MSLIFKLKKLTLFILALAFLSSCAITDELPTEKKRTLLVYMAGNNTLGLNSAKSNIYSMATDIRNGMNDYNLLVFVDIQGTTPVLMHLHGNEMDTLAQYPGKSSLDPKVFGDVIDYVVDNWKADTYGLLMWSHGTGWLPTKQLHYLAPNLKYTQTRSFGQEANPDQSATPKYRCMELDDMVSAIPDGVFDFIAFDACYMGNIEVAYALKNKARYIISSCYEIWSYGFPYHIVTRELLFGNLVKVCREFHKYYDAQPGNGRMAGISLVKTEYLDEVASGFKEIVAGKSDTISRMKTDDIQRFDRFKNHVFYDLEDVAEHICDNAQQLADFKASLERCIQFKISTPYVFYGESDYFTIDRYCGMSVYIPLEKYESSGLNADYRKTEWSRATGY